MLLLLVAWIIAILFTGLPKESTNKWQLVQNAAARILTNTQKRDHISLVLESMHWLPVLFRIDFKVLLMIYKALHNLALTYLSDCLSFYQPAFFLSLRSSNVSLLKVPKECITRKLISI